MENNNQKKYYTLGEMIYGLRGPYQESFETLQNMRDLVSIRSNAEYDAKMELHLAETKIVHPHDAKVYLRISKKDTSSPLTFVGSIRNHFIFSPLRWDKDHALFELVEEDGKFSFKRYGTQYGSDYYKPEVSIPDTLQGEFSKQYEDLRNSPLHSIPQVYIRMNPFQDLFVWGDGLHLSSEGENGKGIDILYDGEKDQIRIKSQKKYSTYFAEELLGTKIPKYDLPGELIAVLDGEESVYDGTFIEGFVGKRKEVLSIGEKEDEKRGKVKTYLNKLN